MSKPENNDMKWDASDAFHWLVSLNVHDDDFDELLLKIQKKSALIEICEILVILKARRLLYTNPDNA